MHADRCGSSSSSNEGQAMDCLVGGDWTEFCKVRGLVAGSRIKVGFPMDNFDILYLSILAEPTG